MKRNPDNQAVLGTDGGYRAHTSGAPSASENQHGFVVLRVQEEHGAQARGGYSVASGGFSLTIPGDPRGQGRPRAVAVRGHARVYPDAKDKSYAQKVHEEWIAAGRPVLPAGPYGMRLWAFFDRPKGHFTQKGALSAEGKRNPWPTRKPDLTNIEKIIEDALVDVGAIPDDSALVVAEAWKWWAQPGGPIPTDRPCVVAEFWSLVSDEEAPRRAGSSSHSKDGGDSPSEAEQERIPEAA